MLGLKYLLLSAMSCASVMGSNEASTMSRLAVHSKNPFDVNVMAITLRDGRTAIFVYDGCKVSPFITLDFYDYGLDTCELDHLFSDEDDDDESFVPYFVTYDTNTSGYGDNYVIGASSKGVNYIASLHADNHGKTCKYCVDCIDAPVLFETSVCWDSRNNYWLGQTIDSRNTRQLVTSTDLKMWEKNQLLNVINSKPLDIFHIADDNDSENIVRIIVWKSDEDGNTQLRYGILNPENSYQYFQAEVLDYSNNWVDFSIIKDNSTDLRNRKCLATLASESPREDSLNTIISCRRLSYSEGKLRQLPLTDLGGPETERNTVDLGPQKVSPGDDPLSVVNGSSSYQINAEYTPSKGNFSFKLFVNPNDVSKCGASVTIDDSAITVQRFNERSTETVKHEDEYSNTEVVPYASTSRTAKVVINVVDGQLDYFINDGQYTGSVQVKTDRTWNRCKLSTSTETNVSKLVYSSVTDRSTDEYQDGDSPVGSGNNGGNHGGPGRNEPYTEENPGGGPGGNPYPPDNPSGPADNLHPGDNGDGGKAGKGGDGK